MVADKMVRTKWYGQNGMDKMVYGQNGIGQNGMDKMAWTKWYNFIFCIHFNSVEFTVFELPGGLGGLNPPTSSCRLPYLWSKFDPGGVEFQPPHLSFAEVGMLFPSHFLLMQFLKYLQCDDLNVTTILIHIED